MRILHPNSVWNDAEVANDELVIATTYEELTAMAGALNESLEALEEWEYETRVGVFPERAMTLQAQIKEVLRTALRTD